MKLKKPLSLFVAFRPTCFMLQRLPTMAINSQSYVPRKRGQKRLLCNDGVRPNCVICESE